MFGFILADLRRSWAGALAVGLILALAAALGVAVTLQERALRLGSARAAAAFDLVIGAPGSETQLVLSSVFLQPAPLTLLPGSALAGLAKDPRVAWAAPIGFGDAHDGMQVVGVTQALIDGLGGVTEGATLARLGDAVAGADAPIALGASFHPVHAELGSAGEIHQDATYTIRGRLAPTGSPWDRAILVPIESVWQVHGMAAGAAHGEDAHADEAHSEDGHAEDHADEARPAEEHSEAEHGDEAHAEADHVDAAQPEGAHADEDHAGEAHAGEAQADATHAEAEHADEDHADGLPAAAERIGAALAGEAPAAGHDGHDHHGGFDADAPIDPDAVADPGAPGVPAIVVRGRTIADAYNLRQEHRTDRTVAVFPAEVLTRLYGALGDARSVLSAVALAAQGLVAASVLLVVTVQVLQRRRQIGALRAFGAGRGAVFAIVWGETALVAMAGMAAGFVLGYFAALAISARLETASGLRLPVEFAPGDWALFLGLIAAAGLCALVPAAIAYRQPPAAALRG